MMRRILAGAVGVAALALVVGATAGARDGSSSSRTATAGLVGPAGASLGTVEVLEGQGRFTIRANVHGLEPGFHGFHIHAVGTCTGPAFASAGGHLNAGRASHPEHAGDMPVLLVGEDGTARASFATDRFGRADLFDMDGSAVIVHADPDNYANIPRDRYDPDPDATTLATGDSGARVACGVIEPA